jgi:hypothetical protein
VDRRREIHKRVTFPDWLIPEKGRERKRDREREREREREINL